MPNTPFQGTTITLRPFEPDDVPVLADRLNQPSLIGQRYIPWKFSDLIPLSSQQIEEIYQKWTTKEKGFHLAIVRQEDQTLVGHAECDWEWDPHTPSIAVVIYPAYRRRGYGSEAFTLLLGYLFEHTVAHVVTCWVADWNQAALSFVAEQGFQTCGRMRRAGLFQGKYYDLVITDLLRSEWQRAGGE